MFPLLILLSTGFAQDLPRLYSAQATSTSFLRSSWNRYNENYHPNYILDDNPKTAWVEGVEGNGENQSITIPTSILSSAKSLTLRVRNGYQKSERLFKANAAIKEAMLIVKYKNEVSVQKKVQLKQQMGWQDIVIELPPEKGVSSITMQILSVYAGTKYKDTCISDVQILVDSKVQYNKKAELVKKQKLNAWIKKRLDDAAYFSKKPVDYPFASAHFKSQSQDYGAEVAAQKFAELTTKFAPLKNQAPWYTRAHKSKIKSLPDGFDYFPEELLPVFTPKSLSMFEANGPQAKKTKNDWGNEEFDSFEEFSISNYRVIKKDGKIKQLYFYKSGTSSERITIEYMNEYFVAYDENEKISELLIHSDVSGDDISENYKHLSFSYNEDGKISDVNVLEMYIYSFWTYNEKTKKEEIEKERSANRTRYSSEQNN